MAIIYALCCMVFTAFADIVYKLFADKRKSIGLFVTVVGVLWLFALQFLSRNYDNLSVTLLWGFISGFLSIVSNILLILAMENLCAGVASTIFRLNMVLVALGACLLFGEPMTWKIAIGLLFALLAITSLLPRNASRETKDLSKNRRGTALACTACILRAGMSLSYKYAFTHGADPNSVTCINAIIWIIAGLAIILLHERRMPRLELGEISFSAANGLILSAVVFFMARMNACGNASVVNPIAQMSFIITFILSVLFLHEKMTRAKGTALACGCIAVIFLSLK